MSEPAVSPPPPGFRLRRNLPAGAAVAVALIGLLVVILLGRPGNIQPAPEPLAADQTLSFPIAQDVGDFDPALISSGADVDILRNVFSGLYRFDPKLREVPDLAVGQPVVSADGLTYTFHLRQDARFSNGDPITADDFIYSWDRSAAKQGDYAGLFGVIAGYSDFVSGKVAQMSGLRTLDDYTLEVTLVKRAAYFQTETGLWPFWLVDKKGIASARDAVWFNKAETQVSSGQFRLTARTPGPWMDFATVARMCCGKTR